MWINVAIVLLIFISLPALWHLAKAVKKEAGRYVVYPWAAAMLLCAFLIENNYVFKMPQSLDRIAIAYDMMGRITI